MIPKPIALAAVVLGPATALAQSPPQPKAPGIESKGYVWNRPSREQAKALKLKGDPERGRVAYEVCRGCHKPDASGLRDGTYPQLAGQHVTVLVKQLVDIRTGSRSNPKMHPFSSERVISVEDVADIAAYLNSLPIPVQNGKGSGEDLERGKAIYATDCETCHGAQGEGSAKKFYPVVAGQHYRYLLREGRDIRDGNRRNANPRMVRVVKKYSDADLETVSDYMSRLALRAPEAVSNQQTR
jgi:cytochrome c553